MPKFTDYLEKFDYVIQGIPCQIAVTKYDTYAPTTTCLQQAISPDDYYGSVEMEWVVLDRTDYLAYWLMDKLTENDEEEVEQSISDYMNEPPEEPY